MAQPMTDHRDHPHLRLMHVLIGSVAALAVGAVLIATIGRVAGFARLTDTLRDGDTKWLAVCVLGQLVVFAGYAGAFQTATAFEHGPHVPLALAGRVSLAGFAFTQLIAAGGAAGLGFMYWVLRQLGLSKRDSAVRLVGLNTAVYLVFGVIGFSAAVLALVLSDAPLGLTLPWIAGVPIVLAAAVWFTQPPHVARRAAADGGVFRRAFGVGVAAAWWVRRIVRAREGRPMLASTTCYWVGDMASLWAALHAFGHVSIVALPVAYTTGYLAQSVPIPLIATGGMDAATTYALHAVGVPLEVALVSVVAHRIFAFWLPIIPGLVFAATLAHTGQALESAASEPAG
jgi:uncharacterized membrane protein YbhN (UPF0104 family)